MLLYQEDHAVSSSNLSVFKVVALSYVYLSVCLLLVVLCCVFAVAKPGMASVDNTYAILMRLEEQYDTLAVELDNEGRWYFLECNDLLSNSGKKRVKYVVNLF